MTLDAFSHPHSRAWLVLGDRGERAVTLARTIATLTLLLGIVGSPHAHAQVTTSSQVTSTQMGRSTDPQWVPTLTEVFATSAMYLSNAGQARVYRLDARELLTAEINGSGLPADRVQAERIVRQRIAAMGPEFNRRIEASMAGTQQMMVYGIQRVPAVVFDGRWVVYGATDIHQAVQVVRQGQALPIAERFKPGKPNLSGGATP